MANPFAVPLIKTATPKRPDHQSARIISGTPHNKNSTAPTAQCA
jgi:hypothetical protein